MSERCAGAGCTLEPAHPFHIPGHSTYLHDFVRRPAPTPPTAHVHEWSYLDGNETEGTESVCRCGAVRDDESGSPAPPTDEALRALVDGLKAKHERGDWADGEYGSGGFLPSDDGLECHTCGNWCDIPATLDRILAAARPAGLDAAWSEVELLLPRGWLLSLEQVFPGEHASKWHADAMSTSDITDGSDGWGSTPVEALTNLAAARARRGSEG
jgi:hypothetical protein